MACPCEDPGCEDVHAHDVTGVLSVTLPVPSLLAGLLKGAAHVPQSPVE
jgi:hypothetical protein